eukprot:jgi/Psemu1/326675/estExt_fgenesh1_pg.C_4410020
MSPSQEHSYDNNQEELPQFESTSSTTVTASENRKSRIRQSQQQIRENNASIPATNLAELRRQRWMLQGQRRTNTVNNNNNNNNTAAQNQNQNEGETAPTKTKTATTTTPARTRNTARSANNDRVPESPGKTSAISASINMTDNSPGSRWSKLSRLQRRPNVINERQSSTATNATAATALIRNTALGSTRSDASKLTKAGKDGMSSGSTTSLSRTKDNSYEGLQSNHNRSISGRDSSTVGPSWKPNRTNINNGNGNRSAMWKEDEKTDKMGYGMGGRILRTEYSSDYDMDDISKADRSRHSTHSVDGPSHSQHNDGNDFLISARYNNNNNNSSAMPSNGLNNNVMGTKRIDDDDRTFDYGDRDDDSNGGTSFARRRREAEQRRSRLAQSNDLGSNSNSIMYNNHAGQSIHQGGGSVMENNGEPKLLSKEEMEHFTTKDNPALRLGAGVAAVATVGLAFSLPAGLLIGVAAGGLGFGYMQIPEEERSKIQVRAEKAMNSFQEKACDASEAMTSSCLTTYEDSGVAEHVPQCLPSHITDQLVPHCPTGTTTKSENLFNSTGGPTINAAQMNGSHHGGVNILEHPAASPMGPLVEQKAAPMSHHERMRTKKVACLRNARILPIAQIHGLDPSSQPRAWLDVVASANTSNDQKIEAMEEILLSAKDKRRAKVFLDEGILDYIIWTLSRYLEKLEVVGKKTDWAFPEITRNERTAAKLAALCCVTLGKAHCAAIHTEGDLLLMSMYERGTVPEERQVAQMLHEVPHHARVTKISDPTIVEPSKEVFAPRQLSLAQAEELAGSIKAVAEGRL